MGKYPPGMSEAEKLRLSQARLKKEREAAKSKGKPTLSEWEKKRAAERKAAEKKREGAMKLAPKGVQSGRNALIEAMTGKNKNKRK